MAWASQMTLWGHQTTVARHQMVWPRSQTTICPPQMAFRRLQTVGRVGQTTGCPPQMRPRGNQTLVRRHQMIFPSRKAVGHTRRGRGRTEGSARERGRLALDRIPAAQGLHPQGERREMALRAAGSGAGRPRSLMAPPQLLKSRLRKPSQPTAIHAASTKTTAATNANHVRGRAASL